MNERVKMNERVNQFNATGQIKAERWQSKSRDLLFNLLKLTDLVKVNILSKDGKFGIPLNTNVMNTIRQEKYTRYDIEINSTLTRRIQVILTVPNENGRFPSIVCIHGHGTHGRNRPYEIDSPFHGIAHILAENGYITIGTEIGQHEVYEEGRILQGERLWDLMRCVDYLMERPEVEQRKIGCIGLSLGGEMAMWLGAMDTRILAVVSSGFLTTVENMRKGHCACWEFPELTQNFDFADIFCLIAPRYLMCQNGEKEPEIGGFPVSIAKEAMNKIKRCYQQFSKEDNVILHIHKGGHEIEVKSCVKFFGSFLFKLQV